MTSTDGTDAGVVEAGDENLATAWRHIGRQAPQGDVVESDDLLLVATGQPVAYFNLAIAKAEPADPDAAVSRIAELYGSRRLPYVLWTRQGAHPHLERAAGEAGLHQVGDAPGMVMAPIPTPPPLPDGFSVTVAADVGGVAEHVEVVAGGFGIPVETARAVFTEGLLGASGALFLTGHHHGEPVATSALVVSGGGRVAGVYNVATPPSHRRQGFGEAMTWAAIAAGRERGCELAVLQSSRMGLPIYERMGFRRYGTYIQLSPGR